MILDMLARQRVVSIRDLLQMFDVSEETVRKDLIAMEEQKILLRRHGSVELVSSGSEATVDIRAAENRSAKERIATAALGFIPSKDGDVIALDSGSTTWCLARLLAQRKGQTIVTNSMKIADVFSTSATGNDVYCAGGLLRGLDKSFYGPWTFRNLSSIHTTVAVLGTNGVRSRDGIGAVSYEDADVKRAYAHNSQRNIAIFDSSKFTTGTLLEAVRWEELDLVITDDGIQDADRERVEKATKLLIV
jgi:DeoR/GlpR family transcriptional regulator of sugar metabolism